jgi:alpha-galactosidase
MQPIKLCGMVLEFETALVDGKPSRASLSHEVTDQHHRIMMSSTDRVKLSRLGLRFTVRGAARFLRNGYHSWDGSWFADVDAISDEEQVGHAVTALLGGEAGGAVIMGFERHDRFQSEFRFTWCGDALVIDAETLLDKTAASSSEILVIFDADDVEIGLQDWSRLVAAASPLQPRLPDKRLTGWCSWYNLYAAITDENIRDHLAAAKAFRDAHEVPLDIFLIDDGFTTEMGDWLDVKPQFPRGMQPLLADIAEAGFVPGLWIAPFLVGNRSRLYAEHPDWVVGDRLTGGPLVALTYYGEFRWHKRSEEYYVLDVTHPDAEAYIATVFRTWAQEWGARYFKTDFMYYGMEHGPDRAVWHTPGFSRVAVWRKMAALIRREIGEDALWLGCGAPLWASVGLVDANRIGHDIGVRWSGGEQSAESLLRDQVSRNHAGGILWQADPDCVLLRDHFHHLSDEQVEGLAWLAGLTGGVLMTSDHLGNLSEARQALFARLLSMPQGACDFPSLGTTGPEIVQTYQAADQRFDLTLNVETGAYILKSPA